jgi:hypothetical protein
MLMYEMRAARGDSFSVASGRRSNLPNTIGAYQTNYQGAERSRFATVSECALENENSFDWLTQKGS